MDTFSALALPRRRKIVELLAGRGHLTATQISKEFDVTAQDITQHLRVLLESKDLVMERHAQSRIYALNPSSIRDLEQWAFKVERSWNTRLDRLGTVLEDSNKSKRK